LPRTDFLDWMKAAGISVIVYGHVAHATTVPLTPPIYLKQLGVVCFLFATGFTLARESRPTSRVLFGRLFPIYLFGLATAAFLTMLGAVSGTGLALSNFYPFLGGMNVVFDNFPANPTTWYLGTYLHLLIVWALWLRGVRIRGWMIALALAIEIPVRTVLMATAGPYVAYMLLTNWSAVFLCGLWLGGKPLTVPQHHVTPYALALAGAGAAWAMTLQGMPLEPTFPFMTLAGWPLLWGALAVSAAVSLVYLAAARLIFETTRRLTAPAPVRFIARNSLIIFLAHMPVFLALSPWLTSLGWSYWERVAVHLLICLPGLALLSEVMTAAVKPKQLGARLFDGVTEWRRSRGKLPVPSLENSR
jgi:peptidoglycan/LPS O-acetylase OafA/YrhL